MFVDPEMEEEGDGLDASSVGGKEILGAACVQRFALGGELRNRRGSSCNGWKQCRCRSGCLRRCLGHGLWRLGGFGFELRFALESSLLRDVGSVGLGVIKLPTNKSGDGEGDGDPGGTVEHKAEVKRGKT